MDKLRLLLFAVRDAFVTLLPLTFIRVLAELAQHLPLPAYQTAMNEMFGTAWISFLGRVIAGSGAAWSLGAVSVIAVYLYNRLIEASGQRDRMPAILVALSALANFMLYALVGRATFFEGLGAGSLTASIVIGIATGVLLYAGSVRRALLPRGIAYTSDVMFFRALEGSPPILIGAGLTVAAAALLPGDILSPRFLTSFVVWLAEATDGGIWVFNIGAAFVSHLSWFLGIHGGLLLNGVAETLFMIPGQSYTGELGSRALYRLFAIIGGAGGTMGLLLAILLSIREGAQLRVARLSAIPSLFNINEILLFGLPIVLNPVFLVPFIAVPVLLSLISVAALESGMITLVSRDVPWTTPPLISAWMATGSLYGVLLQAFCIALSTLIYMPFVRLAERQRKLREALRASAVAAAVTVEKQRAPVIRRQDDIGLTARGLLGDLQEDIARNALELHYQPKLDREGHVVGVEALLRWTHRSHGPLPPQMAVTLAEDGGIIDKLGGWVINEACACKARWNLQGLGALTMALNISPEQLTDPRLADRIADALKRNGLRPSEIELEITESQVISESGAVDDAFRRLMEIGVRLSMDDFGMGYSSLLYLRRFRVSAIKIDGSLSREVLTNDVNADIIRSITTLGRSRGVEIVAEYVESAPQRDALIALGCDLFQGYLHCRPLPEEECADYIAAKG